MKTWACKDRRAAACKGPAGQNIGVVFSGYSALAKAMTAALNEEVDQAAVCTDSDQKWCDAQVDFMVTTTKVAKDREEAIQMALKPDSFLNPKCKPCYAPKPEKNDTSTKEPPFSAKAGLYQGLQFLSVGGANRNGLINAQRLEEYSSKEGLDQIKAAGFEGVCFDVESTEVPYTRCPEWPYNCSLSPNAQCPMPDARCPMPDAQCPIPNAQCPMPNAQFPMSNAQCPVPMPNAQGEEELVAALERAFAACKRAGLLVMVTTSHTAPYAAAFLTRTQTLTLA